MKYKNYNYGTKMMPNALKALCHGADFVNRAIKKRRIRQGSVILLCSEIGEGANDLIPSILKRDYDPRP